MKISSKCAVIALAVGGIATVASAGSVTFTGGIRPGNFNGGEFVGTYTGGELDEQTRRGFCLELDEFLVLDSGSYGYEVVSGSFGAVEGGQGGPNPDPISNATAAVFTAWMTGLIANTPNNARAVQEAIWYLEEEQGATSAANDIITFVDGLAQFDGITFDPGLSDFSEALFPQIRIVNPFDVNSDGSRGLERQSQIILIPLPTASGMALAGLALVGGIRRRK